MVDLKVHHHQDERAVCASRNQFLDNELDAEILFRERYFVTVGANSPWASRRKIELAELANEPWIQMPAETSINTSIVEAFRAHGLDLPRGRASFPDR